MSFKRLTIELKMFVLCPHAYPQSLLRLLWVRVCVFLWFIYVINTELFCADFEQSLESIRIM
jgi:hypothetical protein